jgi:thymidylate synthase ThyX
MITAKIIKDSISPVGKRITTFELEYPRFVHAELLTHRGFSRNAASSRAIPIETMIKQVMDDPAIPVWWGKNQAGMQAKEELSLVDLDSSKLIWLTARNNAVEYARQLSEMGLHKQIANRFLEPWSHIKVVVTSTEWDNWYNLRNHPDAQPEIHKLAEIMLAEHNKSVPVTLNYGDWHLPYTTRYATLPKGEIMYHSGKNEDGSLGLFDLDTAKKVSVSMCAQVSYRKSDDSTEKAIKIYDRLIESKPSHSSPTEHQATPLEDKEKSSGNFKGWLQYRQTIKDNVCNHYPEFKK